MNASTTISKLNTTTSLRAGVLFDLDGTLMDTAPDIAASVNRVRQRMNLAPADFDAVRSVVSKGGARIVDVAFPDFPEAERDAILRECLDDYADNVFQQSFYFDGILDVLNALETAQIPWGIVTNKNTRLTTLLMAATGLDQRAAVIVCGDTLPTRKPDPAPVLHACAQAGLEPSRSVFVGDDLRDIQAGRGAGLTTVGVSFGFSNADEMAEWNADHIISHPLQLLELMGLSA